MYRDVCIYNDIFVPEQCFYFLGTSLPTPFAAFPIAPVPAAALFSRPPAATTVPVPLPALLRPITLPQTLPTITLANQGVAHTLSMSRNGNSAFVTAYAAATSTTIRIPGLSRFHFWACACARPSSVPVLLPLVPLRAASPASSSPSPNHPFLRKYLSNFSMPGARYELSENN
jgi:hypothetical protein